MEIVEQIKQARASALEHTRQARRFNDQRRILMQQLLDEGWSQASIACKLRVTRQVVQEIMSPGVDTAHNA